MRTDRHAAVFLTILLLFSCITLAQPTKRKKPVPAAGKPASLPEPAAYEQLLSGAGQAIVVTTPGWNSVDGTLQRYEKSEGKWLPVGVRVPIVVGKNGLAWDGVAEPPKAEIKREGDGRSPAGIFTLGDAFGFSPSAPDLKLSYRHLTDSIECVDDPSSSSYNELVDRQQLPSPDWNSSEKMRTVDQYQHGVIVNYNDERLPGAGSCIFMHIWSGPGHGTAGCTAMEEETLLEMLSWLDPEKKPVIIQLPAKIYKDLKSSWSLP